MSEPIVERLSRFTPDAGGLDRDSLLYAAGRASARPNRPWIALAAVLAVAQPLSLMLLWPHPVPPTAQQPVRIVYVSVPSVGAVSGSGDGFDFPASWAVHDTLRDFEREENGVPAGAVTFVETGP